MWTVVYLAQSKTIADKIEVALTDQGILVKTRSIGKSKDGEKIFEILVPQSEIDEAYPILTSAIY